ncbi:MAG TPA: S1/P1 nuclease [Nitrospira sp.]|nr:S1/P1 nuclease [Nitrospira sp.]
MRLFLLWIVALLVGSHDASAWESLGHEAIADAAQEHLSPETTKAIAQILGHGTTLPSHALARASTWPDQIRDLQRHGAAASKLAEHEVKEAQAFNAAFPDNAQWHFVNLPLGSAHYPDDADLDDLLTPFTNPHDIVQMLNVCIETLETVGDVTPWTKAQALRWLIHLVGDIHQPLHVTTGYYRTAHQDLPNPVLIENPHDAGQVGVLGDRGGNDLLFSDSARDNLHALWDSCLVKSLAGIRACGQTPAPEDVARLVHLIVQRMRLASASDYRPSGEHFSWAAHWATDSLKTARESKAYKFARRNGIVRDSHLADASIRMTIDAPPTKAEYSTSHEPVVETQLAKAAVRLADLLNHLAWKP